ncbi:MAG: hypothetical protein ACOC8P_00440 [Dichotomicrobium sp.]
MKVRIRHEDQSTGSDCGEMNPEQLHHFIADLKEKGLLDAESEWHQPEFVLQYVDTGDEFFAEIVWSVEKP